MPTSPEFDAAYARLNTEQKAAVDAIDGPVFVIAGPGTGKTQVLTLRIANILRLTDTPPESILALTFTEAAAHEMRERLRRIIGSRAAKVRISTFHGFAGSIITQFPDYFPRIIGAQIATDVERAELLDSVLLSTPVQHLRPFGDPLYYHPFVARAISTLKRENITPDVLEESIVHTKEAFDAREGKVHEKGKYEGKMKQEFVTLQKRIEKTEDLLLVYRAYESALTAARRYDFEDLILEVVSALTNNDSFRLLVQETLLYILADEHQDANRAQNALLELVSGFHERPNLFIVGDEKQAIYRFQGADLDNVQYFRTKFEGTTILTLVENYRSTQSILDTALSLISASPDERLSRVPLIAHTDVVAKPLRLITATSIDQELAQLAENISTLITHGTVASDIAVLVRRNKDIPDVARALMRAGIPVVGGEDEDALQNRFVQALVRLLRVAANPLDELIAGVLTLPGFPLSAADAVRVTHFARKERKTILSVLAEKGLLLEANVRDTEAAARLGASIEELARLASYERPAAIAERALQLSGLLPRSLTSPDRAEALAAIRGLLLAFEDLSRREHGALLPRALKLLDLYEARGMSLPGRGGQDDTRVKVMTVHRSKGREFAQVFIPLLTSNAWSTRARPEHFDLPGVLSGSNELEDERRLLYVAITRAKQHATLSYAVTGYDDRAQDPSELTDELNPELLERTPATAVVEALSTVVTSDHATPSKEDLETLRAAFFSQGLSPTALNNYLECPWKYFYVNLLRIPEIENKYMLFGTAMHVALKRYADDRIRGTEIGTEGLISTFTYNLERAPLSDRELTEMKEKGERALTAWWQGRHASWPAQTKAEVPIQADLTLPDGSVLGIRGALDRIDEISGGVAVVDYKTGKVKSRNDLLGNTKDANGNYYRQLTFYKLLLERTEESRSMQKGIIEFVEPDDKGRIRTEEFDITDEDVRELEACIQKASQDITTLSFWNNPCDEHECPWCVLRFSL
jgi:DNA helicase II / ATP-dependent DNA helicase PcrA